MNAMNDKEYFILFAAICDAIEQLEDINKVLLAQSIDEVVLKLKKAGQITEEDYIRQ